MREKRRFTLHVLLDTLATGDEADASGNLLKYIHQLEKAGVLQRSKHRLPAQPGVVGSTGYTVWRLEKDLGRSAPVWRKRDRALYDPNASKLIAVESVTDTHEAHDE